MSYFKNPSLSASSIKPIQKPYKRVKRSSHMQIQAPHHLCFETLGNELRIKLIHKLIEKPRSVSELAQELQIERTNVSHALKVLKLCSMVDLKKEGKNNIYFITNKQLFGNDEHILKILDNHFQEYCKTCKKL
jgi:DNA-binding transcriptional ArsR family regulator